MGQFLTGRLQSLCAHCHNSDKRRSQLEPRQLDQPVALALAEVIDDVIGDARRLDAVHDQANDAEAPPGGVLLCLDSEETITRKDRRPDLDPASV